RPRVAGPPLPLASPSPRCRLPRSRPPLRARLRGDYGLRLLPDGIVWFRILGPLLGGTVFIFGLILAIALAGIGIGGWLYSLRSEGRPATLWTFASTCL